MKKNNSELMPSKDLFLFKQAFGFLDTKDKSKFAILLTLQVSLAFLELLTLASAGIVAALAVSGFSQKNPDPRVYSFLEMIGIVNLSVQAQAAVLSLAIIGAIFLKTVLSILLLHKTTKFLGHRGVRISTEKLRDIYSRPIDFIERHKEQALMFSLTTGIDRITLGILASYAQLVVDVSLVLAISMALFYVDPLILLLSFTFFSGVGIIYYSATSEKLHDIGKLERKITVNSESNLLELLRSYRENLLGATGESKIESWNSQRARIVDLTAKRIFLSGLGRHIIEFSVVLGSLAMAAIQFVLYDATKAAAATGVFFMASTRIAPAIIRIQQELMKIRYAAGNADTALDLLKELNVDGGGLSPESKEYYGFLSKLESDFEPSISVKELSYSFNQDSNHMFKDISLEIDSGKKIAVLGPSGAGKSTFIDLILGVRLPDSGTIRIGGVEPRTLHRKRPNSISFVPQQISLINGTIRENLLIGNNIQASDEDIRHCLKSASLESWVFSNPGGLDYVIKDRGVNLSGGQRQRLGIARALLSKSNMLILDEATSSLDVETEEKIVKHLEISKHLKSIVIIAHRKSTIEDCDELIYIDSGEIVCCNSFLELSKIDKAMNYMDSLLKK